MNETKDIVLVLIDVAMALGFYRYFGLPTALGAVCGGIFYFTVMR